MISKADLAAAGQVNKTHGIAGELSMSFYSYAIAGAIGEGSCLIMDVDGIFTPFFVAAVRPRGNESLLVRLDGVDTQEDAAFFVGRKAYMLAADMPAPDDEADDGDADGFYAAQLVGFTAVDARSGNKTIGEIVDIDDQTQNVLFVIERPEGGIVYIPVADEFISGLSPEDKTIAFCLPEGLI